MAFIIRDHLTGSQLPVYSKDGRLATTQGFTSEREARDYLMGACSAMSKKEKFLKDRKSPRFEIQAYSHES